MRDRRWSILATHEGRVSARRFELSPPVLAALALGSLLVAAGAFWVGRTSGLAAGDERAGALRAAVDSLTEENAKVAALGARLEQLEANYERVRAVMGGEVAPSARDILLPPVRSSAEAVASTDGAEGRPALWPLVESGFVTRSFGDTIPGEGPHEGLDIAVPVGSYVRAAGPGVVAETGEDEEYGRFVRIAHADEEFRTLYAHNSWTFVSPGDSVEAGEVIALSGNTGRSTAPHLHLEIERSGTRVDPLPFVSDRS